MPSMMKTLRMMLRDVVTQKRFIHCVVEQSRVRGVRRDF